MEIKEIFDIMDFSFPVTSFTILAESSKKKLHV
jgi:hypothetical protein